MSLEERVSGMRLCIIGQAGTRQCQPSVIEEEQGAQHLVLSGGGDFVAHRERRQERADFGSAHNISSTG
jgi:hypothetical protein